MATVESMTLSRLLDLEADTVIGGHINGSGHLILEQHDASTIDAGYMLASVPDASLTVKGIVELATLAETTLMTDATRAVTPAGLSEIYDDLDTRITAADGAISALDTRVDALEAISIVNTVYPVGSVYMATVSTNPGTLFGVGTWAAIEGRFLIGADGTYTAGSTGGAPTATLTTTELPAHTHSFSATTGSDGIHDHQIGVDSIAGTGSGEFAVNGPADSAGEAGTGTIFDSGSHTHSVSGTTGSNGSGTAFSILPPYLSVYMWRRTA